MIHWITPESVEKMVAAASQIAGPDVVAVRASGWSWTTYGVWALVALMSPIVIALTRLWPAMQKLRNEADGSLRSDLMERVSKLEKDLREERLECDRRMIGMQRKMDAVTRQFVAFQIAVARSLSPDIAPAAQQAADRLAVIIATDASEFEPESLELMAGELHTGNG